ncbi:amino acid adenylation protein [Clostridia bacterium]|nr:amino acid adenylation protein [Clostridia bacterium]
MQRNLMEYLEHSERLFPDKTAFTDGKTSLTFAELSQRARSVGSALSDYRREPIAVFMDKQPDMIAAFFGVLYSGCFYVPLDAEMSAYRISAILDALKPRAVICDAKAAKAMERLSYDGHIYMYSELLSAPIDSPALDAIRAAALDTDPAYLVYTSGSTGTPKGVVANHRNVIDYIEQLGAVLKVDEHTIFGNQTPLYVDACLKELYPTIKYGATTVIIPKSLFLFPLKLLEFIEKHNINTLCWVVSALTMISGYGALDSASPKGLRVVAFGSEVFPPKQLRLWRQALPDTRFINLYGPTEATGMSCYYEVKRDFADDEPIPIGRAFPNTEVMLIDGEIYIRGAGVASGYYGDAERTHQVFVQNPQNDKYTEIVYKTGDLAYYNPHGELVYSSRRDHQIKHMGYRIELAEIEAAAALEDGIALTCCVFDKARSKIALYYTGTLESGDLIKRLVARLPRYMVPAFAEKLDALPLTNNGKIDRVTLTKKAEER